MTDNTPDLPAPLRREVPPAEPTPIRNYGGWTRRPPSMASPFTEDRASPPRRAAAAAPATATRHFPRDPMANATPIIRTDDNRFWPSITNLWQEEITGLSLPTLRGKIRDGEPVDGRIYRAATPQEIAAHLAATAGEPPAAKDERKVLTATEFEAALDRAFAPKETSSTTPAARVEPKDPPPAAADVEEPAADAPVADAAEAVDEPPAVEEPSSAAELEPEPALAVTDGPHAAPAADAEFEQMWSEAVAEVQAKHEGRVDAASDGEPSISEPIRARPPVEPIERPATPRPADAPPADPGPPIIGDHRGRVRIWFVECVDCTPETIALIVGEFGKMAEGKP